MPGSKSPQKWRKEGFESKDEFTQWRKENRVSRTDFERSWFYENLGRFVEFMIYEIPPGPAFIPMRYYVNAHKGTMAFYLFGMMLYFDNFSTAAWIYFCLHGSYGFFWLFRDVCFPDPGFTRKCTVLSVLMPWPIACLPYMMPGYWIMSRQAPQDPSIERIVVCFWLYVFGIMFMVLTDAQKFLVLRERPQGKGGLITHCMVSWSRNMNYLGEMMLYASFGVLLQRWEIWFIYAYMWGIIFIIRMKTKDYSLSKKEGWTEYKQNTWLIFPKLNNSTLLSIVVYGLALALIWHCYTHDGIETGIKGLLKPLMGNQAKTKTDL